MTGWIEIAAGAIGDGASVPLLSFNPLGSPDHIDLALDDDAFEPNMMDQIGSFGPSIWV